MSKHSSKSFRGSLLNDNSPFAMKEAYNAIRTKLMFTVKGETCPIIAVTSALMHDGKTTNAVNLAISIAQAGKKVLLIDGDMRRPSIHARFELELKDGLSEILAGITKEIHLHRTTNENLSVLTAGQIPPNPAELLGSEQLSTLLEYVRKHFDYVVIDTPPVNIVTDAAVLAGKITGYLFIVQAGSNHFRDLDAALRTLEQVRANILGLVLNDMDGSAEKRYAYRYGKGAYSTRYSQKYGVYE